MDPLTVITQSDVLKALVSTHQGCPDGVDLDQLTERLCCPRADVAQRIRGLLQAGLVEAKGIGAYAATQKGLTCSGSCRRSGAMLGEERQTRRAKPVDTTGIRQRLWTSLKIQQKATISDILQCALQDDEDVGKARQSAWLLMRQLCKTGYVVKMPRRRRSATSRSNGEVVYWLTRDTGRLVPAAHTHRKMKTKGMLDRNTEAFFAFEITQATPPAVGQAEQ